MGKEERARKIAVGAKRRLEFSFFQGDSNTKCGLSNRGSSDRWDSQTMTFAEKGKGWRLPTRDPSHAEL